MNSLSEDAAGHVERHDPVRRVDDLADLQVAGRAAEDVGLAAGEIVGDRGSRPTSRSCSGQRFWRLP